VPKADIALQQKDKAASRPSFNKESRLGFGQAAEFFSSAQAEPSKATDAIHEQRQGRRQQRQTKSCMRRRDKR